MKNKFCYILIGILVSFFFVNNVFAFEYSMDVILDTTEVVVGSEVDVKIALKTDTVIDACLIKIEVDDNIEFLSTSDLNGWVVEKNGVGTNGIIVENNSENTNLSSGLNILNLKYKVNGNGTLKLSTSSYCSDGVSDVFAQEKNVTFTTTNLSEVTTLSSIKINGEQVPNFSSNVYDSYAFVLESPTFSLSYETTNSDFSDDVVVMMNDEVITNLDNIVWSDPTGQKTAELKLIVNDTTTYTIGVHYEGIGLDNTFKSLKINGEEVQLVAGQTNKIKVGNDVTSVKVEAVLNDSENFKLDDSFEDGVLIHNFLGTTSSFVIEVIPISDQIGGSSVSYIIEIEKESSNESVSSDGSTTNSSSSNDVEKNPPTGNMSMFIMALILISSLVGSILLYQKNLESYK